MSGQIAISPKNPSVVSGKTITLTSNMPVTWHLTGTGSLTNVTSTSLTYTAPAGIVANNQMLGCPVGPNDSIFNTRIDALPVNSKSNTWIGASTSNPTTFEADNWGISVADNSTPMRTLRTYYSDETVPDFVMPAAGPNLKRQGGDYVGIFGFENPPDHHVMTVRHTDCTFYESYDDYLGGYTRACRNGAAGCNVQSAITYSSMTYAVAGPDGGTNAGSLPLAPTIWNLAEIQSGTIRHATTFTTNTAAIAFNEFLWPAAGSAGGCDAATCPNAMPMGARLRLKSSFNIASVCNSGISAEDAVCDTMLTALKQYGMILSDTGLSNAVQILSEVTEDANVTAAAEKLASAHIPFTNFEAVDESSLEVKASSYQVCPRGTACMNGVNSYVTPSNQAVITATNLSGQSLATPIALQAVGIGLGIPPVVAIAAGNYSYQIPAWVNGSSDQTVHWKLVSGVGSVTSWGLYTPPPSTGGAGVTESTVLHGVSDADSASSITLHLKVIPSASNGAVRIDTGAPASTTDANGNAWAADVGIEGGAAAVPNDYPHWNKSTPAATVVYESQQKGADLGNTIIVPNGTYNLHLLFGLPSNGSCSPCGSWLSTPWWDQYSFAPYVLEAQGKVQNSDFDFGSIVNYMYQKPADAYMKVAVTNNLLQVYVRSVMSDVAPYHAPTKSDPGKYTLLNGIEAVPAAGTPEVAPSWTINTNGQNSIALGQTLKAFSLVTAGGAPDNPTWKILSGPTGATLSGSQLSLSASASPNSVPVVVQASDGTYSAKASIATPAKVVIVQSAFHYSRKLTISHLHAGTADLVNFPVLVSVVDQTLASTSAGGHVVSAAGYDLVFASDSAGSNLVPWEVESYNNLNGTFVAHVLLPRLSHTADTVFYMFYGNPKVVSTEVKPATVWSNGYVGVYHFKGAPLSTADSSGQGDSPLSSSLAYAPAGQIAGAAAAFNSNATLPPTVLDHTAGTFEAWVSTNLMTLPRASWVVLAQNGATSNDYFHLGWNGLIGGLEAVWSSNTAGSSDIKSQSAIPSSSIHPWNHVAYTWDAKAKTQSLYWNGTLMASLSGSIPLLSTSHAVTLGSYVSPYVESVQGMLDEVRLSNTARTANWVAAEYSNQSSPSSFIVLGTEVNHN